MPFTPSDEGFIDVEGGRVWYRRFGARGGTPLLMLHGGPGTPHDYLEPLAVLSDEREVVFYDQLGAGKSSRPREPEFWTVARFVRELATVRTALALEEVHVYGQSWGTSLAVEYALTGDGGQAAKGIRSLVLSSPCLSASRWRSDMERLLAAMPEPERTAIAQGRAANELNTPAYRAAITAFNRRHLARVDAPTEEMRRTFAGSNPSVYSAVWGPTDFEATGAMRTFERAGDLGWLSMPVLYMCGRHDGATPETTAWYADLTPDAEVAVFEDSSHLAHIEEPDAYEAALRRFLRAVDERG